MAETWKPVPRFEGIYEVSDMGNVRHVFPNKPPRPVKEYIGTTKRYSARVNLFDNGRRENFVITRLVWEAFRGPVPEGKIVTHKNGQRYNNELRNLELTTYSELYKKAAGKWRKRTVVKINKQGEVLKFYGSCTECAKAEGYSHASIAARCNNKRTDPWDFDFYYEDSAKSRNDALRRLGILKEKKNGTKRKTDAAIPD